MKLPLPKTVRLGSRVMFDAKLRPDWLRVIAPAPPAIFVAPTHLLLRGIIAGMVMQMTPG